MEQANMEALFERIAASLEAIIAAQSPSKPAPEIYDCSNDYQTVTEFFNQFERYVSSVYGNDTAVHLQVLPQYLSGEAKHIALAYGPSAQYDTVKQRIIVELARRPLDSSPLTDFQEMKRKPGESLLVLSIRLETFLKQIEFLEADCKETLLRNKLVSLIHPEAVKRMNIQFSTRVEVPLADIVSLGSQLESMFMDDAFKATASLPLVPAVNRISPIPSVHPGNKSEQGRKAWPNKKLGKSSSSNKAAVPCSNLMQPQNRSESPRTIYKCGAIQAPSVNLSSTATNSPSFRKAPVYPKTSPSMNSNRHNLLTHPYRDDVPVGGQYQNFQCHRCRKYGHIRKHCTVPKPHRKPRQRPFFTRNSHSNSIMPLANETPDVQRSASTTKDFYRIATVPIESACVNLNNCSSESFVSESPTVNVLAKPSKVLSTMVMPQDALPNELTPVLSTNTVSQDALPLSRNMPRNVPSTRAMPRDTPHNSQTVTSPSKIPSSIFNDKSILPCPLSTEDDNYEDHLSESPHEISYHFAGSQNHAPVTPIKCKPETKLPSIENVNLHRPPASIDFSKLNVPGSVNLPTNEAYSCIPSVSPFPPSFISNGFIRLGGGTVSPVSRNSPP